MRETWRVQIQGGERQRTEGKLIETVRQYYNKNMTTDKENNWRYKSETGEFGEERESQQVSLSHLPTT